MTKADKFKAHCDAIVINHSDIRQTTIDLTDIVKNKIVELCKLHYSFVVDLNISQANNFLNNIGNSFYLTTNVKEGDTEKSIVMISRLYQNLYYDPKTETLEEYIDYTNNAFDKLFLYSYLYKNIANRLSKHIIDIPSVVEKAYNSIISEAEKESIMSNEEEHEEERPF